MKTLVVVVVSALLMSCTTRNNLALGRTEETIAGHKIIVTDCYRTSVPDPKQVQPDEWRYAPCRDADILIKGNELTVNGQAYGRLEPTQGVLVDHGVVHLLKN